jgi:hypothetical protein
MPQELPIACSLGADDLVARLDLIAAIGAESLLSEAPKATPSCSGSGATRTYAARPALVLVIDAPTDAAPVAAELAAAFARPDARRARVARPRRRPGG